MSLLLNTGMPAWMTDQQLHDALRPLLPEVEMYCGRPAQVMPDVTVAAVVDSASHLWSYLPNLRLVQKLGAGVDQILADPQLPEQVSVARLAPDIQANEIAEYALSYVLAEQRNMRFHERHASDKTWHPIPPKQAQQTTVAVLGLGNIGRRTAILFASLGFNVLGWSRTPKTIEKVDCRAGIEALDDLLPECDYVISILPTTSQTANLFNAARLARMKSNAILINAGRGELIDESALIDALNNAELGGAVLDVFRQEPLLQTHPLWTHPNVTITPHVSGWHIDGGLDDVAENYRRVMSGRPLLHEVDKKRGY